MRLLTIALALVATVATASAQRHKLADINADTPEGQLLQQIGGESDETKKLSLIEDFIAKFPQHEGAAWVYEQMIPATPRPGNTIRPLQSGDKLIAADPDDVESAYACLQAAEAKKDADLVTSGPAPLPPRPANSPRLPSLPRPVRLRTGSTAWTMPNRWTCGLEYSLYATMLQITDPRKKIALGEALEKRNPQSQYLPQMAEQRLLAYVQAGEAAKGYALADKAVASGQASLEMLLAAAEATARRSSPTERSR